MIPAATTSVGSAGLGTLHTVRAGVLDVAYFETGPAEGPAVLLLHGFPYDVHSYVDVAPQLAAAGMRVIVPYLRGHSPTRFRDPATPRSGQQAALGADIVALIDALGLPRAVLAGYDWGWRAVNIVAALWPDRCASLVSVNNYLIQDISTAAQPIRPDLEAGFWYFHYFATERSRRGLTANRRGIAEVIWRRNSPDWYFDDTLLDRTAEAFRNEDYVQVVIHSYRQRLGLAPGDPSYEAIERQLARQPDIPVPSITLDGEADGNFSATDGSASAAHFTGPRTHRRVPHAGHNLPQESPAAFAATVLDLARPAQPQLHRLS
ncbi:alpha/beta fold hydrolase [Streptomyces aureus]|uniref:Alpha/beta fold hydrolase n=1 Tax=Streptomyces aureus TaxID=193461 RepID=A0ABV4SYV7_9ACTN